uniref:Uncharacterized protein n=1 Tax=Panagrellus redivivus TaxID=6233 RepID=A0A7E4ZTG6_PANRE
MRLLVELLFSLILLTPFADALLYYRVKGEFYCHGQPTEVKIKIIEHDPNDDDLVDNFSVNSKFDHTGADQDLFFYPNDELELSIHATFDCGCKGELYQFIDPVFQRHQTDSEIPMVLGSVELSDVCQNGEVKAKYDGSDEWYQHRQWMVGDE